MNDCIHPGARLVFALCPKSSSAIGRQPPFARRSTDDRSCDRLQQGKHVLTSQSVSLQSGRPDRAWKRKHFVKGGPLVPAGHGMIRSRRKSENIRKNISSVSTRSWNPKRRAFLVSETIS